MGFSVVKRAALLPRAPHPRFMKGAALQLAGGPPIFKHGSVLRHCTLTMARMGVRVLSSGLKADENHFYNVCNGFLAVVVLMVFGGKILRFEWQPAIRTLPEGHVVVAIGDVHGHAEWLALLHDAIARELDELAPQRATVVHLGDLIDRGPDNMGALRLAKRGVSGAANITLRGNHEDRLLSYLDGDTAVLGPWLDSGGGGMFTQLKLDPALASPQEMRARIDEELMLWLEETPLMHREANLVFVHAGIDPIRSLDRQDPHTLMWTRKAWIDSPGPYPEGVAVVHGHIPRRTIDFRDRHRIDLDSGVSNWGVLSGLVIAGNRMRLLQVS